MYGFIKYILSKALENAQFYLLRLKSSVALDRIRINEMKTEFVPFNQAEGLLIMFKGNVLNQEVVFFLALCMNYS